jgi:hypothetical protein
MDQPTNLLNLNAIIPTMGVFFEAGRAAESCSVFAPFPGHGPALVWRV